MIQIDLTNPSHVNTLRWACGLSAEERACIVGSAARNCVEKRACAVISSPEQSVVIVRALLEAHKFVPSDVGNSEHNVYFTFVDCHFEPGHWIGGTVYVTHKDIPALIIALLDALTPSATLAALRKAGG